MHEDYNSKLDSLIGTVATDPDRLEQAIQFEAKHVLDVRVRRKFFERCYKELHGQSACLERRFLNFGPGSFLHPYWKTADKEYGEKNETWTDMHGGLRQSTPDYAWDMYEKKPINEKEGFFKIIYSSHVIEHGPDKDVQFLLSDMNRLLEIGGRLRLVCPDADIYSRYYAEKNYLAVAYYDLVSTKRRLVLEDSNIMEYISSFILEWCSLVTHKENSVFIPFGKRQEFIEGHNSVIAAIDAASMASDRDLNKHLGKHVNWFNYQKLKPMLKKAGFRRISCCGFKKSAEPVLWADPFDNTDRNMSLYVEAIK